MKNEFHVPIFAFDSFDIVADMKANLCRAGFMVSTKAICLSLNVFFPRKKIV
jgi:hypothetical protein